jgi:hypothetical protein
MTLLESSGIVDFGALPTAPPPAAATGGSASNAQARTPAAAGTPLGLGSTPVLAFVVVALASAGLTFFILRHVNRDARRPYRRQRARYYAS